MHHYRRLLWLILGFIITTGVLGLLLTNNQKMTELPKSSFSNIRYLPIGDSYTIGLGVPKDKNWPTVLINHLKENSLDINLIDNPAVSGYEVEDAITYQLPVAEKLKPNFVTVLIGANDQFRDQDPKLFGEQLNILLDRLEKIVPKKKILLLTLPDYTVAPVSNNYDLPPQLQDQIKEYNRVISEEGQKRNLPIVDLFPLSQKLGSDSANFISDGLHPSAEGYAQWEKVIYPVAYELLTK